MTRRVFFFIHWFLGITAGTVLAVLGITGAMLSFEQEIMDMISKDVVFVDPTGNIPLHPDELIARASAQKNHRHVSSLLMNGDPARAASLVFSPVPAEKIRAERSYVNPYTGELLGNRSGQAFFSTVMAVHRWLALPGEYTAVGRHITGFSLLALIFFCISGIYLRWPRRPLEWRSWLVLDLRMTGRNLYYALHAVVGGWMVLFYMLAALTGLWWSYTWYRDGVRYALTGVSSPSGPRARRPQPPKKMPVQIPLGPSWESFQKDSGGKFQRVRITIPMDKQPVSYSVLLSDAYHNRMTDDYRIDAQSGRILKVERYANRPWGENIVSSMYEIHRGAFFGLPGRITLFLTSLAMPLFSVTGFLLYFARRRSQKALESFESAQSIPASEVLEGANLIVVYASQTGGGELMARQTGAAFGHVPVIPISRLTETILGNTQRILFVVSTYGDGEAPDEARGFARYMKNAPSNFGHLEYAILSRGDSQYPYFCAFGDVLEEWLRSGGARPLFESIRMDGEDLPAQGRWKKQIEKLGAVTDAGWEPVKFSEWRLVERLHLNPGSLGGDAFHLTLEPVSTEEFDWQAGDIAEIQPCNDPSLISAWLKAANLKEDIVMDSVPLTKALASRKLPAEFPEPNIDLASWLESIEHLPTREYSIASVPQDGQLHLLVRQVKNSAGSLGLGSGWLTSFAPLGGEIRLRLRENPNFRPPEDSCPLILIGNGTGLAGLRAHLRNRAIRGVSGNWLMFGERSTVHDAFHDVELRQYVASGILERLDRSWSRDSTCGRYVQDLVLTASEHIQTWVDRGAAIYVCGSIQGMAPAVDYALRKILGEELVNSLAENGRYRRDVY